MFGIVCIEQSQTYMGMIAISARWPGQSEGGLVVTGGQIDVQEWDV